jgi:deoxyadenosine/deoxycytidine kinase
MRQRLVAEIVGPAAVGKSTLSTLLSQRDRTLRAGLSVWHMPRRMVLLNLRFALPVLLDFYRVVGWLSWEEFKQISRLIIFHRLVKQKWVKDYRTVILDEGAVFALAKLSAFGREDIKSRFTDKWSHLLLEQWARTLNTIIWLDAPDSILTHRIRARSKAHQVKEKTDLEISEFLATYRHSYHKIISDLTTYCDLKVIKFNTAELAQERLVEEVFAALQKD